MKARNYVVALGLTFLTTAALNAQEYKVTVQNTKEGKLSLVDFPGDLPIEGYSGNEIIITSDKKHETPQRAKGLTPLYGAGTDNTGIGLAVEKNGNQLTVRCLLSITQGGKYKIRVPDNFKIEVESECGKGGSVSVENTKNEVEVKNCHNIDIKNASGALVLSTISGNVEISLTALPKDKPFSFASISGEIDITLPAKAAVDLDMHTVTGSIYSDFDFPADEKEKTMKKIAGGNSIKAQLNGGGTDLKINNVSGNIYLRKGK
jgi:lia operon protein LiaG